jgi:hypothetical protein
MGRLLNREQVYLISEKAVEVNQSASGVLANLALKPISMLIGSIKQHYRKQQLETLIMQWAGEYAKAVKPDMGPPEADAAEEVTTGEIPNIDSKVEIVPEKPVETTKNIIEELKKDIATLGNIAKLVVKLPANGIMDDSIFKAFKKEFNELETLYFEEYMNELKKDIDEKDINEIVANIKSYNTFIEALYNAPTAAKVKQIFQSTFKDVYKSKLDEIKLILNQLNKQLNTVLYILQQKHKAGEEKPAEQKPTEQKPEDNQQQQPAANTAPEKPAATTVPAKPKPEVKPDPKTGKYPRGYHPNTMKKWASNSPSEALMFSEYLEMIKEAKYVIPREPNELISELDLQQLIKENPKLKEEATKRVNIKRLDILEYEAQFILNKTRTNTDSKPGNTNADLQRVWDIGIKKVNDYFQSVVDVDAVMKQVKPQADEKKKKEIEADEAQITNLENMNITQVFKVGEKFDPNKVYAFDCTVTGLKSLSATLLVSPTTHFIDDDSGTTQYWFKLLGAYRYDEKSKRIIRLNIWKNIVSNQKIINNKSYHYIAMRNLRPSVNSGSYAFLYSNFGNIYYNNEEYKDTSQISKDLTQLAGQGKFSDRAKNLMKTANSIRIKMHQRFIVEDADIQAKKFDGINTAEITNDKNIDKAKHNNQLLMDILGDDK